MPEFVHLHAHTSYSLGDATTLIPAAVQRAKELGMKAMAITDHGTMAGVVEFATECARTQYKRKAKDGKTDEAYDLPAIKPILGMEAYVAFKSSKEPRSLDNPTGHMILLARNQEGFRNLCALLEYSHQYGHHYVPRIDLDIIAKHSKGLICLTACLGGLPQKCMVGWRVWNAKTRVSEASNPRPDLLAGVVDRVKAAFEPGSFFLEVMYHKVPGDPNAIVHAYAMEVYKDMIDKQFEVIKQTLDLSKKMRIPAVLTNDVHYLTPEMAETRSVVNAAERKKVLPYGFEGTMADQESLRIRKQALDVLEHPGDYEPAKAREHRNKVELHEFTKQMYIKSPDEMAAIPDKDRQFLLKNSVHVADMIETIKFAPPKDKDGKAKWNLPVIDLRGRQTSQEALRQDVMAGFDLRYPESSASRQDALKQVEYELKVMENLKLEDYHLMVADVVQEAKRRNIPVGCGRGSGAGSIVVYCLGITDLDPLKHRLVFERYLNPERASAADLDVDFDPRFVEDLVDYLVNKYGQDRVAKVSTYGTVHARGAIKGCARVFGLSNTETHELSESLPDDDTKLSDILKKPSSEEAARLGKFKREGGIVAENMLDVACKLHGVHIIRSQHAAGVVISGTSLRDSVPLVLHGRARGGDRDDVETKEEKDVETVLATEVSWQSLEPLGLLKLDLLVVDGLTVIDKALTWIYQKDTKFRLPYEWEEDYKDPLTLGVLCNGDLAGIWQLSSSGMRELCVRLQPTNLDEISAICALYRPGPLDYVEKSPGPEFGLNMVEVFLRRKNKKLPVTYDHPMLEPILQETYGVIVFQEQIMYVARALCGWSYAQADYLRKAVAKKVKEDVEKQKDLFIPAAVANGVNEDLARRIFEKIETFGRYGFNKAHSSAYAKIAYQMAYVKARYPQEFLAACISVNATKNRKEKVGYLHDFVDECARKGISVLGPDVVWSQPTTVPENHSIRLGFDCIKGVASAAAKIPGAKIEDKDDIPSTIRKLIGAGVNKSILTCLARAGCFDSKEPNRARTIKAIHLMTQIKSKARMLKKGNPNKKMVEFFGLADKDLDNLTKELQVTVKGEEKDEDIVIGETLSPQEIERDFKIHLQLVPAREPVPPPKGIVFEVDKEELASVLECFRTLPVGKMEATMLHHEADKTYRIYMGRFETAKLDGVLSGCKVMRVL